MTVDASSAAALKSSFESAGQGHVFAFFDSLTPEQKSALVNELKNVDPEYCNAIFKKATSTVPGASFSVAPLPDAAFDSTMDAPKEKIAAWHKKGMELISQGKVGVILMAGGQGTRLGSSAPKGCYDIQLHSHKSLFALQAERILRLQTLASNQTGKSVVIPWYIMKLGDATPEYFAANNYFGLKKENIFFFEQGTLPAFTMDGKILLEAKHKLSLAPDGNGGIYRALRSSGALDDMSKRGVEFLHTYGVDNCLVRVADPTFIGYCVSHNAECGAKVVRKRDPSEAVGVICLRGGKAAVVEYSEIDPAISAERKPDGKLVYAAANIANHFYTLSFLKRIKQFEGDLEYHIAKKKIKHVSIPSGEPQNPTTPNGIKLELFVFDVFPHVPLEQFAVLEVDRIDEFSPLKNAPGTGVDCPETSRHDILALHKRFLEHAGATVGEGVEVELGASLTYAGEGLEFAKGKKIGKSGFAGTKAELEALFV